MAASNASTERTGVGLCRVCCGAELLVLHNSSERWSPAHVEQVYYRGIVPRALVRFRANDTEWVPLDPRCVQVLGSSRRKSAHSIAAVGGGEDGSVSTAADPASAPLTRVGGESSSWC